MTGGTESLLEQCENQLMWEYGGIFMLLYTVYYSDVNNVALMSNNCGVDPMMQVATFLCYILIPIALARSYVYLRYRGVTNYQKFLSLSFALTVYWNATFGMWTLANFFMMINAPVECGAVPFSLIKLSYHVLLIIGAFPAIMFMLGVFFFTCFMPYYFYDRIRRRTARRAERVRTREMLKSLYRCEFDPARFTFQDECCICLGDFEQKNQLAVLPCDSRHYFHTCCIENWFKYHRACPFCKIEVTQIAIDKTKEEYQSKFESPDNHDENV